MVAGAAVLALPDDWLLKSVPARAGQVPHMLGHLQEFLLDGVAAVCADRGRGRPRLAATAEPGSRTEHVVLQQSLANNSEFFFLNFFFQIMGRQDIVFWFGGLLDSYFISFG